VVLDKDRLAGMISKDRRTPMDPTALGPPMRQRGSRPVARVSDSASTSKSDFSDLYRYLSLIFQVTYTIPQID
jgi:hypothetical protein